MTKDRPEQILVVKYPLCLHWMDFLQNPSIPFLCLLAGSFYLLRIVVASCPAGLTRKERRSGSGQIRALWYTKPSKAFTA